MPGCICAIAADDKSTDTVWFVKIAERSEADKKCTNDYGHTVRQGNEYFSGKYLEWENETRHKTSFKEMKKKQCSFTELVLYTPLLILKRVKTYFT